MSVSFMVHAVRFRCGVFQDGWSLNPCIASDQGSKEFWFAVAPLLGMSQPSALPSDSVLPLSYHALSPSFPQDLDVSLSGSEDQVWLTEIPVAPSRTVNWQGQLRRFHTSDLLVSRHWRSGGDSNSPTRPSSQT